MNYISVENGVFKIPSKEYKKIKNRVNNIYNGKSNEQIETVLDYIRTFPVICYLDDQYNY